MIEAKVTSALGTLHLEMLKLSEALEQANVRVAELEKELEELKKKGSPPHLAVVPEAAG